MTTTLYWHDYETFGRDPRRDRAAQFAGVRTDEDLNIIGEPLMLYCRPAEDFLPDPESCLITGITPQHAARQGVTEAEFIARIHDELAAPGTCGVGYNTLRFDDEFTRNLLYRNFYDPYAREWQHGCSRWDILDMVRLTWALRPEGIQWPTHDDGRPSFKLEQLSAANGLQHDAAHDALSDVLATIAMAKLIKTTQPKLYDYVYQMRDKRKVGELIDLQEKRPLLHVSGMYPVEQGCLALVAPIAMHPTNKNEVVVFDLRADPTPLFELDIDAIRERLFTKADQLPEGVGRLPLKTIHLNKCPVVASAKLLEPKLAERWQVDRAQCEAHWQMLRQWDLSQKLATVFERPEREPLTDPDQMLYSGFFGPKDKAQINKIRASTPVELARQHFDFEDSRLPELLFRYRARNFPETLSDAEAAQWAEYREWRLTDPAGGASLTIDDYLAKIELLQADPAMTPDQAQVLDALMAYAEQLMG
ncbi:exodeoxyribonuclease-1 [Chitinivorax tropicus]|uniref:Exodeoxyribonuclease I n=1 Tax=Chitinivorax tropicus TaxID=714531 RepID=A0A840MI44_9PROT|nr:exodeoxyribonuclease-1 [Chitinivorax tropicus]